MLESSPLVADFPLYGSAPRSCADSVEHILIIDDDEPIRRLLVRVLEIGGFRCTTAASGAQARQLLADHDFSLALCDLTLPDVSGFSLIEYIAATHPTCALLLVTGVDDPEIAARAIHLGAFGYIIKPFEANEILISVISGLRRRRLELAASASQAELERQVGVRTQALARAVEELQDTAVALRGRDERFRQLAEASPAPILLFDREGCAVFVNAAARRLADGASEPLLEHGWQDFIHPEDRFAVDAWLFAASAANHTGVASTAAEAFQCRVITLRGDLRWLRIRVAVTRGDDQRVTGAVVVGEDVTDQRAAEQELERLAHTDQLTGLGNRSVLLAKLTAALAPTRHARTHALLFLDLDRFKLVNDSHGHIAGDQVLTIVAQRLSDTVARSGTLARLGSDEFVIMIEDTPSPRQVIRLAERILASIRASISLEGREFCVAAAIGIAFGRSGEDHPEKVLADADIALHRAKLLGGNGYEIFDESMRRHLNERLGIEMRMRRAVDREEFALHYQPEFTPEGALVGFEALLRWYDTDLGDVAPSEFVPIAEESGLILPLGRWALAHACAQARAWNHIRPAGRPLLMSVNLSALQLRDPLLVEYVSSALDRSGLAPSCLCLEITESVIMDDAAETVPVLENLRAIGVRLAVDDFGTGYSSLSYLAELPVDYLKVDRTFIDGVGHKASSETIVVAVLQLAHGLGLQVIAEGVESTEQLNWLRGKGCDITQGFLLGRPAAAAQYESLVAALAPPPTDEPVSRWSTHLAAGVSRP